MTEQANAKNKSDKTLPRKLKVTLVKSPIGFNEKQSRVVQSMGLRRIRHSVQLADTPEMRGMIFKVRHLVEVSE